MSRSGFTPRFCGFVALSTAVVLFVAAIWKALDPMYFMYGLRGALGQNAYPSLLWVAAVVSAELLLAMWLVWGVRRHLALVTSAALFLGFCAYHIYINTYGTGVPCSCLGKFWGQFDIKPHKLVDFITAALPAVLLVTAVWLTERRGNRLPTRVSPLAHLGRVRALVIIAMALAGLASLGHLAHETRTRSMFGIGGLWGTFESTSAPGHPTTDLQRHLGVALRTHPGSIRDHDGLVDICTRKIATHGSSWTAAAYDRISVREFERGIPEQLTMKRPLGLESGDLPLYFRPEANPVPGRGPSCAVSIPVIRHARRLLLVYVFEQRGARWTFRKLFVLGFLDADGPVGELL